MGSVGAILLFAGIILVPVGLWANVVFIPTGVVMSLVGLALVGLADRRSR